MPDVPQATAPSINRSPDPDSVPIYSHQQILRVVTGIMLCIFLASLDQTVVIPAVPAIAGDLNAFGAPVVDRDGLPADLHGSDTHHRQAVRHLWPPRHAAAGAGRLHRGQPWLRPGAKPAAADCGARGAGPGRRRADGHGAGSNRRRGVAARTGALSGLHGVHVGHLLHLGSPSSAAGSRTISPGATSSGPTCRSACWRCCCATGRCS